MVRLAVASVVVEALVMVATVAIASLVTLIPRLYFSILIVLIININVNLSNAFLPSYACKQNLYVLYGSHRLLFAIFAVLYIPFSGLLVRQQLVLSFSFPWFYL